MENKIKELNDKIALAKLGGGEKRATIVVPEGVTKADGCCLRKANKQPKHITQVKIPSLKYVLFSLIWLKI